jgi:hypothetical protein
MTSARKLADEKRRLERDEEAAEEELIRLQAEFSRIHNEMNAQFSKITRLRRQRRQVEVKGMDMIQRGLNSMDELEKAEKDEEAALELAKSNGTFRDWSAVAEQSTFESLGLGSYIDPSLFSDVAGESSSGVAGH